MREFAHHDGARLTLAAARHAPRGYADGVHGCPVVSQPWSRGPAGLQRDMIHDRLPHRDREAPARRA